jgi:hypothetical protein
MRKNLLQATGAMGCFLPGGTLLTSRIWLVAEGIKKVIRSLLLMLLMFSSVLVFAQPCVDCSTHITVSTGDDIYVSPSETVCIPRDVVCSGRVIMQGGTLCNNGEVQNLWIEDASGVVENYYRIEAANPLPSILGELIINNYPLADFKMSTGAELGMNTTGLLNFNVYNQSDLTFQDELALSSGTIHIYTGLNWPDDPAYTGNSHAWFKDIKINGASLLIDASQRSDIHIDGSFTLTGAVSRTVVIENSGLFKMTGSLYKGKGSLTNSGLFYVEQDLMNTGGSFSNDTQGSEVYADRLINTGAASFYNMGKIGVTNTFSNTGAFNTESKSSVFVNGYYNAGEITGPFLSAAEAVDYDNWARLFIDGNSINTGYVSGHVIIYDNTLDNNSSNIGLGFDDVLYPGNIDGHVGFAVTSQGPGANPPVHVNCDMFFSEYWIRFQVMKASDNICPEKSIELRASLGFQLQVPPPLNNTPAPLNPSPTFVWQPGSLTGQVVQVSPANTTVYTVTSTYLNCPFTKTISLNVRNDCPEEIVGCCFGNYGTSVWIEPATYMNVYCNLINEIGNTNGVVSDGEFKSKEGYLRVYLNWYHNARNYFYKPLNISKTILVWDTDFGVTSFFGADQQIKGIRRSHFNNLWLEGNGTKSIWIDAACESDLDLNGNILDIQDFTFTMRNIQGSVSRTNGYATNRIGGYFSRYFGTTAEVSGQAYLFPLGARATMLTPFRYRPLVMANLSSSLRDEVSAGFMNIPPNTPADPDFSTTNMNLSPSVAHINKKYYHKIKNTLSRSSSSDISIKSYYNATSDGYFQSLSEWERDPSQPQDWWGTTPGANSSTVISSDPGTQGMVYAMASGTFGFNHPPFSLARSGFYINTSSFANTPNSAGTTISLTANAHGGGGTPTGGGLNNSYGTGTNGGNNGNGGVTTFTPSPVAGEYIITVTPPNSCAVPGKIRFVIDQYGVIQATDVLYGVPGMTGYLGQLSDDAYTIDNVNTGINLISTPKALLMDCVNSITVCSSGGGANHIVHLSNNEDLMVKLPVTQPNQTITYGSLQVYDSASNLVPLNAVNLTAGGIHLITPASSFAPGVYRFELTVIASTTPPISETIKGQFIVIP